MAVSYTPLEGNIIQSVGGNTQNITSIDNPSFFSSTSFLYTLAFVIIVVTASFRYAYAGMLRIQATEKGIKDSKEEFKRVTYGLLGVFGLWLVLFTINKDMLTGDVNLDQFKAEKVKQSASVTTSPVVTPGGNSAINNPTIPANNSDPVGWNAIANDSTVRAQLLNLSNGGISVNKTVCNNPTQKSCTTVGGLPQDTLTMLSQLRSTCSGTIMITGGTEAGHQSHGPGLTPVDISINSPGGLNDCINSFQKGEAKTWCKSTYEKFGYIFCDEINSEAHWHVYKK
jgi:hypothetical protein